MKALLLRAVVLARRRKHLADTTRRSYQGRLDRELDAIMVLAPTNQHGKRLRKRYGKVRGHLSPFWSIRTFHRITMAARGNCGPQPHTAKLQVDSVPSGEPICSLAFDPSLAPQHDGVRCISGNSCCPGRRICHSAGMSRYEKSGAAHKSRCICPNALQIRLMA